MIHDSWNNIIIPFGKYKGYSLYKIYEKNPGYISWMAGNIDGDFRIYAQKILKGEPFSKDESIKLSKVGNLIYIKAPFEKKDEIKELPNRRWDADNKVWTVPISVLRNVIEMFPEAILDNELNAELEKQKELSQLSNKAKDENINIEFGENLKLLPFQSVGVKFLESANGKALISDEMGLGKSIQTVSYIRLHPELRPTLIVCPASLKLNWKREAEKWLTPNEKISIINGNIEPNQTIYIINYDILSKHEEKLKSMNFKVLILDESHYVKNYKSQRTKSTISISKNIPNRILLTGTPVLNRPNELWQQLNIIDSVNYAKFTDFAFRYCAPVSNGYGYDFSGASNTQELNDRLKTIMIRRTKEQVLKELPDKRRQTIILNLDNNNEYIKAHTDFVRFCIEKGKDVVTNEHLVKIEALKQLSAKGKIEAFKLWIDDFLETGEKLVCFAWHTEIINMLHEVYKDISVVLTGETSMENRQKAIDQFQNNPNIKLFFGNIKAAGVGITLTTSSNVAFLEFPWTPGELVQAEDRCHRIGQKNAVNIYNFVGKNSDKMIYIDEIIIEMLQKKMTVIDAVIDGKEQTNLNIFNNLIERLKQ